ncbi:MAG TPA: transcription-repair coupling factor [Rhodothermales bacterium]
MKSAAGSLAAFALHHLQASVQTPVLCITPDEDQASYLFSDLEQLPQSSVPPVRLPASGRKPYDLEQIPDPTPIVERADVLEHLTEGRAGLIVASLDALYERVPSPQAVHAETIAIRSGDMLPPDQLVERLMERGFSRVEFVDEPGELALRGGILDIFPFAGAFPIRVEFFGDEVDSLREFDPKTQRSVSRLSQARIVPNVETALAGGHTLAPFFDYLPDDTLIAVFDEARLLEKAASLFETAEAEFEKALSANGQELPPSPAEKYLDADNIREALGRHPRIGFGSFGTTGGSTVDMRARPQPDFNSSIGLLKDRLLQHRREGIDCFILCDSRGQEGRLHELLQDDDGAVPATLLVESLHQGFEVPGLGLAVYTDHQIFNRYHRPTARRQKKRLGGMSLRELQTLNPGDFVVHVDYGIGKFAGMQKIEVRGKQQEAVRVLFAEEDVLYVNVNALHKLHKYSGKEGHQPRLTKLGSGQWERTKSKTKKRVKDIARDLIKLYARRKASRGFAFSGDTVWQRELEASFQFEDTPDQAAAAAAVKQDMEQPFPMDRLVCGDVGFGKTEVAVRAAFKAVQDGKQVAVLVPTTILAKQHAETFTRRLQNFPVRIDVMSRFRSTAEMKEIVERAAAGKVDIVIGTHRIASKDVRFKNLGLLIIDEEQRFGVAAKERLRQLRAEVDTLTLTATPIPRTLQFSLLGARDLSIMSTPPPNRQPIVSEIHTFDRDLIRDAILYETSRGGQIFFIHNRVQSIDEMAAQIRALVPTVRVRVAHGQMQGKELEQVMLDFVDRKFDVLVSTNIIENGLDISNANTIIINHAERFGLAELHQLRGRVGRSDRKAFCYLLVPSVHVLTREARQRLQAVEEFSELGSGFSIAMRDLDIRGAGNMLGAEQSGFIEDVGFETYHKILDDAVRELRAEEFSDLFAAEPVPAPSETVIDVEEDAFIPETYVSNNVERLNIYRRISDAQEIVALGEVRAELEDRFGELPQEVLNLLAAAELKIVATSLRVPRITYKNERLFLETPGQEDDPYFYEKVFHPLLERFSALDRRFVLKESKSKKLRVIVQDVPTLEGARAVIESLVGTEQPQSAEA